MIHIKITFVAIVLLELLRLGESYLITIDARAQECFHERVQSGTKLSKCAKRRKVNVNKQIQQIWNSFVWPKVWCSKRWTVASTTSSWKLRIPKIKSSTTATKRHPANTHSAQTRLACTRKAFALFIHHTPCDRFAIDCGKPHTSIDVRTSCVRWCLYFCQLIRFTDIALWTRRAAWHRKRWCSQWIWAMLHAHQVHQTRTKKDTPN